MPNGTSGGVGGSEVQTRSLPDPPFAEAPSTAYAMNSLPGRGRYGWAGGMHATLLRVYGVMPCIEHPIGWFDQCEASWQMG